MQRFQNLILMFCPIIIRTNHLKASINTCLMPIAITTKLNNRKIKSFEYIFFRILCPDNVNYKNKLKYSQGFFDEDGFTMFVLLALRFITTLLVSCEFLLEIACYYYYYGCWPTICVLGLTGTTLIM